MSRVANGQQKTAKSTDPKGFRGRTKRIFGYVRLSGRKLFERVEATTGSLLRVDVAKRQKIMGALVLRSV